MILKVDETPAADWIRSTLHYAANEVAVHHEWNDFNDGHVSITGSADVMWMKRHTRVKRHVTMPCAWPVQRPPN